MLPRGRHGTEIVGLALPELVAAPPIEAPVVEEQHGEPLPEPPTTEFVLVGEHMYTAANLDSTASSQAWLRHGRALDLPSPPAGPPTTHESRASQTGPELREVATQTIDVVVLDPNTFDYVPLQLAAAAPAHTLPPPPPPCGSRPPAAAPPPPPPAPPTADPRWLPGHQARADLWPSVAATGERFYAVCANPTADVEVRGVHASYGSAAYAALVDLAGGGQAGFRRLRFHSAPSLEDALALYVGEASARGAPARAAFYAW